MSQTDPRAYVRAQKLAPVNEAYLRSRSLGTFESADDEASAHLNNRSIVSFVSGVAGQARRDTLNATLFAQLAADYDFPRMKDPKGWLNRYTEVLNEIGWNMQGGQERVYSSELNEFDMNKAMLKIMGGALLGPGGQIAVITATLDALKELGENADDIKVFERKLEQLDTTSFQLGLANETDGAVALTISTFEVKTREGSRRILFFRGGKDEIELKYRYTQGTLNEDVYGRVRTDIVQMLGDGAVKAVRGIKLAKL